MRYTLFTQSSPRQSWSEYANALLRYDKQRGGVVNQDGILYEMDPQHLKEGILVGHDAKNARIYAIPETHFAYNMRLFYKISTECLETVADRDKLWAVLDKTLRRSVLV